MMFQKTDTNPEEVKNLMKLTFYTQRKQVNRGKTIKYLMEEWPFWFRELGMEVDFKELTGIGLNETLIRNDKNKKLLQAVTKLKVVRGELTGYSEDVKDMVLLLLSCFDEKEDVMFCYVKDTCLAEEVQMDQLYLTPTIE